MNMPTAKKITIAAVCSAALMSLQSAHASPRAATAKVGIPGPRTCFWLRGPVSADPYVNIAYPDANTFYWSATFSIPQGARLSLEGDFPRARYMSLISYDAGGRPIEALPTI